MKEVEVEKVVEKEVAVEVTPTPVPLGYTRCTSKPHAHHGRSRR